ncbi:MAG: secretin and TonB N-terminal domain-containing protein, partial [Candidatus Omnitrophica bacterium]|nr:secretin and TonB N-terminal domain-containing protein [Candidatus Omnitrophota bacterium]
MRTKRKLLYTPLIFLCTASLVFAQNGVEPQILHTNAAKTAEVGKEAAKAVAAELITVDFNKADIQSVLRILALKGNVNIVAGPDVAGEVTIQLKDVYWEDAFDTIVKTYGYTYTKEGNIYHVLTTEDLESRRE